MKIYFANGIYITKKTIQDLDEENKTVNEIDYKTNENCTNIIFLYLTKPLYAFRIYLEGNELFDRTAIAQAACSFLFLSSKYHTDTISRHLHGAPVFLL